MSGIHNDINLYALYDDIIKYPPKEHQYKNMDTNTDTYSFEESNYSEEMLRFSEKFRQKHDGDFSQIQSIWRIYNINNQDFSSSMSKFAHVINATTYGKCGLYMNWYANTPMLLLNNNNFNEASKTLRYVTLVGSKKDLKELSVIIVSVSAAADLPNGTIITQFNE